jgi:hypothetical protein
MTKNTKRISILLALAASSSLLATSPIQTDAKKAFPDVKTFKCGTCHTKAMPKKEDAKEMTAYGTSVVANPVKDDKGKPVLGADGKTPTYDWKKIGSPDKPAK